MAVDGAADLGVVRKDQVVVGEQRDRTGAGVDRTIDEQVMAAGVSRRHEDIARAGGQGLVEGDVVVAVGAPVYQIDAAGAGGQGEVGGVGGGIDCRVAVSLEGTEGRAD